LRFQKYQDNIINEYLELIEQAEILYYDNESYIEKIDEAKNK
jgi:hypothetical protein